MAWLLIGDSSATYQDECAKMQREEAAPISAEESAPWAHVWQAFGRETTRVD